jgi:hypothetical protein
MCCFVNLKISMHNWNRNSNTENSKFQIPNSNFTMGVWSFFCHELRKFTQIEFVLIREIRGEHFPINWNLEFIPRLWDWNLI